MKSYESVAIFDFLYSYSALEIFLKFRPYFIEAQDNKGFENIKSEFDPTQHALKLYIQNLTSDASAKYLDNVYTISNEFQTAFHHALAVFSNNTALLELLQPFYDMAKNINSHCEKHYKVGSPTSFTIYPLRRLDVWNEINLIVKHISNDLKKESYNYAENEIEQSKLQASKTLVTVDLQLNYYMKIINNLLNYEPKKAVLRLVPLSIKKIELLDNYDIKSFIYNMHECIEQAMTELLYLFILTKDKKLKSEIQEMNKQLTALHQAIRFVSYDSETTLEIVDIETINIKKMLAKLF